MKVIVCWEDARYEPLFKALRRALRHLNAPGNRELFVDSAHGHGGFDRFVVEDWPRARDKGIAKSHGSIDYLICVADADRVADILPEVGPP